MILRIPRSLLLLTTLGAVLMVTCPSITRAAGGAALNTPVWYVDLEMSLEASRADTRKEGNATLGTTMTLRRVVAGIVKLDLRSGGPAVSMLIQAMENPGAAMDPQAMLARMDHTANWMEGGGEMPGDLDGLRQHMVDLSLPVTLEYERVDTGRNLVDEMNRGYDRTTRTTRRGTGKGYLGGQVKFEMDTADRKFWLVIPPGFQDMEGMVAAIKEEREERIHTKGGEPVVTTASSTLTIDAFPRELMLETPSAMGQYVFITGDLDPTNTTITGKSTIPMTFKDGVDVTPATLTVTYRLTPTPPATKPGAGDKSG